MRKTLEVGRGLLRKKAWWALVSMYAVCGFQDFLVATHIVALALDEGVSGFVAGNMLAFMGLAGLVGVIATGVLNDRYGPNLPTAGCFVLRCLLFGALLLSRDHSVIVLVALGYGFTFWITAPLTVIYARALAGLAVLGAVTGTITMIHHASGGLGALVGAWVFDRSGHYDDAIVWLLATSALALALTPWFPRPREEVDGPGDV